MYSAVQHLLISNLVFGQDKCLDILTHVYLKSQTGVVVPLRIVFTPEGIQFAHVPDSCLPVLVHMSMSTVRCKIGELDLSTIQHKSIT